MQEATTGNREYRKSFLRTISGFDSVQIGSIDRNLIPPIEGDADYNPVSK